MISALLVMTILSSLSFDEAKVRADADESSLSPASTRLLVESQGLVSGRAFQKCLAETGIRSLPRFAIVMKLDGDGHVVQTWRSGGGEFGACINGEFSGARLFMPPHPGFYTSFVFRFVSKA